MPKMLFEDDLQDEMSGMPFEDDLGAQHTQNPLIGKIAEFVSRHPHLRHGVESFAPIAEKTTRALSATGLPSAGQGVAESLQDIIRGHLNLIPGVNLPRAEQMEIPEVNPTAQRIAHTLGRIAGYAPAAAEGELLAAKLGAPLAGAISGGASSPDDRFTGAALGAAFPAAKYVAKFPITEGRAASKLNKASRLAEEQGIELPGISSPLTTKIQTLIRKTLGENEPMEDILKEASKGGYHKQFELQSHLGDLARRLSRSPGVEGVRGTQANALRQELLEEMTHGLSQNKAEHIAKLMREGQKDWKTYSKYGPKIHKAALITGAGAIGLPPIIKSLL